MDAIDSLDRAEIVAVTSRNIHRARKAMRGRSSAAYGDLDDMLDKQRPDAVFVCVPPYAAPTICLKLAQKDVPFLVEKPVAALDRELASQVGDEVECRGLVAAVGYHLRGLEFLDIVRESIRRDPPELIIARWTGGEPKSEWWSIPELSGGQVVEQMTHLYDLARVLAGEAEVIAAASLAGSTSALLRFRSGVMGVFVNSHHAHETRIAFEVVRGATITLDPARKEWALVRDGASTRPQRNPYAVQAAAFLDAIETRSPGRVLATYRDGLATHLLTLQVAAAAKRAQ